MSELESIPKTAKPIADYIRNNVPRPKSFKQMPGFMAISGIIHRSGKFTPQDKTLYVKWYIDVSFQTPFKAVTNAIWGEK